MALRTPLSVSPHLYLGDSTGRPLDFGMVYFGQQDKDPEFYPIDIYTDDSLTMPIAQPVRTKGGFLNDKGDMVEIHAREVIYSVKILDQYGRKIFYKGAMMRSSWNDDVIERINEGILAAQSEATRITASVAMNAVSAALDGIAIDANLVNDALIATVPIDPSRVVRTQRDKNSDFTHVRDFGLKGDGSDETIAMIKAVSSGKALYWGDKTYRHSGVDLVVDNIRWKSDGARILYIGSYAPNAFKVTISEDSYSHGTLTFDANSLANRAIEINSSKTSYSETLPSFVSSNLVGCNAKRNSKDLDGSFCVGINGGFQLVYAKELKGLNGFMSVGSDNLLIAGMNAINITTNNGLRPKHIILESPHAENIWSEDVNFKNDQDGIRIYQSMTNIDSTCCIHNYTCVNVANRAIKLNSTPNALINGVFRTLDADVIPQSGQFQNPDIDCQQGGAFISNVRVHYKGAWHQQVVRNHSESNSGYNYFGSHTDNITLYVQDAPNNDITLVAVSSLGANPTADGLFYRANISNLSAVGTIKSFVSASLASNSKNYIQISNAVGEIGGVGIDINSSVAGDFNIQLSNVSNTGAQKQLINTELTDKRRVFGTSVSGFSDVKGISQNTAGWGFGGLPEATFDFYSKSAVSANVRLRGSSALNDASSESDYIGWFEFYHQGLGRRLGLIGMGSGTNSDLDIRNESATGDIRIKVNGSSTRIQARQTGGVLLYGDSECSGVLSGASLKVKGGGDATWGSGSATPEGAITAVRGSIYSHTATDGGLYVKTTSTGNTGWKKVTLTP